ncbi:hypothetical protein N431DRAFT_445585 [Stipitochalara longipes BDJ]|nr:hypothetical protein N431DRAFT_445585 [Stipitochalara longipes BDJ]
MPRAVQFLLIIFPFVPTTTSNTQQSLPSVQSYTVTAWAQPVKMIAFNAHGPDATLRFASCGPHATKSVRLLRYLPQPTLMEASASSAMPDVDKCSETSFNSTMQLASTNAYHVQPGQPRGAHQLKNMPSSRLSSSWQSSMKPPLPSTSGGRPSSRRQIVHVDEASASMRAQLEISAHTLATSCANRRSSSSRTFLPQINQSITRTGDAIKHIEAHASSMANSAGSRYKHAVQPFVSHRVLHSQTEKEKITPNDLSLQQSLTQDLEIELFAWPISIPVLVSLSTSTPNFGLNDLLDRPVPLRFPIKVIRTKIARHTQLMAERKGRFIHILSFAFIWGSAEREKYVLVRLNQDNWHRILDMSRGDDYQYFSDTWKQLLKKHPKKRKRFEEECEICKNSAIVLRMW